MPIELNDLAQLVDPSQAALIIVDVQNDFCHEDGTLERSGLDRAPVRAMVPNLQRLIAAAEAANLPIVYIRNLSDDWSTSRTWRRRMSTYTAPICRRGTWGAEFYGITPRPQGRSRFSGVVGSGTSPGSKPVPSSVMWISKRSGRMR